MRGLWKGWVPNCQRAALVQVGDLTTYDATKQLLRRRFDFPDGPVLHAICSGAAGLVAATLGAPADVVKTRVMNQVRFGGADKASAFEPPFVRRVQHEAPFSHPHRLTVACVHLWLLSLWKLAADGPAWRRPAVLVVMGLLAQDGGGGGGPGAVEGLAAHVDAHGTLVPDLLRYL